MKLIYILITYQFVGNHLRANHQSVLISNRPPHKYLCLQSLLLSLLLREEHARRSDLLPRPGILLDYSLITWGA
jgi:hypothetical protein